MDRYHSRDRIRRLYDWTEHQTRLSVDTPTHNRVNFLTTRSMTLPQNAIRSDEVLLAIYRSLPKTPFGTVGY
jgi:hypothetical protein